MGSSGLATPIREFKKRIATMIVKRGLGMRTERQRIIGLDVGEGRHLLFPTILSGSRFYTSADIVKQP